MEINSTDIRELIELLEDYLSYIDDNEMEKDDNIKFDFKKIINEAGVKVE